jgi:hypothetical protein
MLKIPEVKPVVFIHGWTLNHNMFEYQFFLLHYTKAEYSLKVSPHCLRYELSHCVEEPKYHTLRIEWDSEEGHIMGFRTSSGS